MTPVRCFAGQPFGGFDKRCNIAAIKLVTDYGVSGDEVDFEIADFKFDNSASNYDSVKRKVVFQHKGSVRDSGDFFEFAEPLRCNDGIVVTTNDNCRPIFYIR